MINDVLFDKYHYMYLFVTYNVVWCVLQHVCLYVKFEELNIVIALTGITLNRTSNCQFSLFYFVIVTV